MTPIDLRLPDEAIRYVDLLKTRYPTIGGRYSRTSVIVGLLCECPVQSPEEQVLRDELCGWIVVQGIGTAAT